jgi:hypothetical protein
MTQAPVPYVEQALSHGAQLFRQAINSLLPLTASGFAYGGTINPNDYLVTPQGSPNMTVNVAGGVPGGQAWVQGTTNVGVQGLYYCFNDATVIQPIAASDPSNGRIDISCLQVQDAFYAGAVNSASLVIVTGTPSGSPVPPTQPASSIQLAEIAVAALATSITGGDITNSPQSLAAGVPYGNGLGSISVPNDTLTAVPITLISSNYGVVSASDALQIPFGGMYQLSASASCNGTSGKLLVAITDNTIQVSGGAATVPMTTGVPTDQVSASTTAFCNSGDLIGVSVTQETGGSIDVAAYLTVNYLSCA